MIIFGVGHIHSKYKQAFTLFNDAAALISVLPGRYLWYGMLKESAEFRWRNTALRPTKWITKGNRI
ncbi:MAG: hypothetical protein SRB2_02715 [Desulfobacteraceae bacterium Eth-SRB2]|nr:MAG: hypothetical protein SRB2_02715 [Desulfobacteraceae bacterium Eth-SRB2]